MKRPLRTEDELWAWFRYMRNFDLTRLEERRQLIDVFVNTVFLYNDRFLLTLNFGYGSKTMLFTDTPCSDKVACGRPKNTLVFMTEVFFYTNDSIRTYGVVTQARAVLWGSEQKTIDNCFFEARCTKQRDTQVSLRM